MIPATKALRDEMQHATDMAVIAAADANLRDTCEDFRDVLGRTSDVTDLATLKDTARSWIDRVMAVNVLAEQKLNDAQFLAGRR